MLSDKTIFVTGGAGFIGYNICRYYLANNVKCLVVYDDFSSGRKEFITDLASEFPNSEIMVVIGDILDYPRLASYMQKFKPDVVNHHAAQLEITKCLLDPEFDIHSNLIGTLNVLKAMVVCKCSTLINASSACVYGQNVERIPSVEERCPTPHWVYGMSKYSAEHLITIFCNDYNINAVSFRYSIVMGKGEWYGRVGTLFINRALEHKDLVVFGSGEQARDIVDVRVAADANLKAIAYLEHNTGHTVFNVSSGNTITVFDLAEKVIDITGSSSGIIFEDVEEGQVSKYVDKRVR